MIILFYYCFTRGFDKSMNFSLSYVMKIKSLLKKLNTNNYFFQNDLKSM